ncbi:hypothetical protein HC956_02120 [Alcaligenes faecalis]|uniref:Uncharacterized protein n=2 Tax=Pseudomonadota TaxID=1224 RepID=A0ABT2R223_9GAMM|nr:MULTISPECIES: hypothetical protein [Pseudomonadota]MCU5783821.1 hypothetical protein [Alloalcanivorax balearicus MACL04]QXX77925.1 hypothetical protein FE795_02120 [Alcaligenes ammonioxydans]
MAEKKRAKNLSESDIDRIVDILDGWSGTPLTWSFLIDEIERKLFRRYTRQALNRYHRIKLAYAVSKERHLPQAYENELLHPELRVALEQIEKLTAQNRRLEEENQQLLEQFARWAYNAYQAGISEAQLNRDLPPVNRGQTTR